MLYIDPVNLLIQICDFVARCRHKINLEYFEK